MGNDQTTDWLNICRTGVWIDKNGKRINITKGFLDRTVKKYNPVQREAPLVFGHPEEDGPAFGWAAALRRSGEFLQAKFRQVSQEVKNLVRNHHYKKISCAFTLDGDLWHVGLLGATQPAVSGLGDFHLADGIDLAIIDLPTVLSGEPAAEPSKKSSGEPSAKPSTKPSTQLSTEQKQEDSMTLEEAQRQLEEEKAKRQQAETELASAKEKEAKNTTELAAMQKERREMEIDAKCNNLLGKDKIYAKDIPVIKAVALALPVDGEKIELSAGTGEKAVVEHLFDWLLSRPNLGLLSEFSGPGDGDGDAGNGSAGKPPESMAKYI